MALNKQVEALLATFAEIPPPDFATMTPQALRLANDKPLALGPPASLARVENLLIPLPDRQIEARLYVPDDPGIDEPPPPLTLFFHGGGWVIGTLDTHDATCRALARESGSAILSVAYRLAPEHGFPKGLDDCLDALCWAAENGASLGVDTDRIALAGDSAGGNLAAATALRARDEDGPALRHQLLIYPVTDNDFSRPSYVEHGGGDRFLSTAAMQWFWKSYLGAAPADGLSAIQRAPDLANLPATTVITAEYDPLRDEGMAFAKRLSDAGIAVEAKVAPGMIHGFFSLFEFVPDARPWISYAGTRLREALA